MLSKVENRMVGNFVLGVVVGARQPGSCYLRGVGALPQPLSHEDECWALLCKNEGDLRARNTLVEHNLRLVVYIARRYMGSCIHIEDLVSVGTIGLIKAINSFKFGRNAKLATYASHCIENEILMALRRAKRRHKEISFDKPISVDSSGNELLLSDVCSTGDDWISRELERDEESQLLHQAIRRLNPKEQKVIGLRFGLYDGSARTQREIAGIVGTSQSYISKLEKRICKQLRASLRPALYADQRARG